LFVFFPIYAVIFLSITATQVNSLPGSSNNLLKEATATPLYIDDSGAESDEYGPALPPPPQGKTALII